MLANIWNTVYPILIAILFFELIIIIHEGGHFVAARLMKIKVNEFSIGMGPKLIQFKKGDTKYTLRLILFGGYCAMEGESEDSDDENSFAKKKVWRRFFVVVAGALMNLILGFLVIVIMLSSGSLIGTTEIAKFDDKAVSSATLKQGDIIKSIDGMRVYTSTDVTTGLSRSGDDTLDMTVLRDGKTLDLKVKFNMEKYEGRNFINMDFWLVGNKKTVGGVIKESFKEWVSFTRMVFLSVHDMIVGKYGLSDLAGPVGTVSVVSTAVKTSAYSMLRIMALLTINVGLFNLFPIPALDGWRLFLLGLMCVITFSDITKLL